MTDFVITVDDNDESLGNFFRLCANSVRSIIRNANISFIEMSSLKLKNNIAITQQLMGVSHPFIFVALTHGNENSLIGSENAPYIAIGQNSDKFTGALFYCFSCSAGKKLGEDIVANGGKCFIGHNKKIFGHNYPQWQVHFHRPIEVFFIHLNNGDSISNCIKYKKVEYTKIIDEIYNKDAFIAAHLLENRDSLVVHGDAGHTIFDFI
jgi:hypothetical protein